MEVKSKKSIVVRVNSVFYKELRKICADKEITVTDFVINLLIKENPILKDFKE
jgi:predicted DNA-binding ribbon-helix-helix protein